MLGPLRIVCLKCSRSEVLKVDAVQSKALDTYRDRHYGNGCNKQCSIAAHGSILGLWGQSQPAHRQMNCSLFVRSHVEFPRGNKMARKLLVALACAAGSGIPAGAQRFEVQPFAGYTVAGELPLDRHNPGGAFIRFKNSASAGITLGVNATESIGAEFLWSRQPTTVTGYDFGDVFLRRTDARLDQFHGNLIYTFRHGEAKLRPFILAGAGATRGAGEYASDVRFSFALGGGLKYFMNPNFGLRLQARWTPTYLYSTPGGLWCDWWGYCSVSPIPTFFHQGDATIGFMFRF